jgi:uncharacterized protein
MVIKVNDIDLRVLGLFTKGYNREHYIREVEKLLKISSRTALLTLDKLERCGILQSIIKGKIKTYHIKNSRMSMEYFLMAEQYKRIRFLNENPLIGEILMRLDIDGIVLVFGSYAKGLQKEGSDLDIFIVGKHDRDLIREIGLRYGVDVSVKSYPQTVFRKGDDTLLREIAENHIIVQGAEEYVRRVREWTR